ncbi:hypothetical protein JT200_01695 [Helicobacter pylori]|nr:hypothetical protein [Helicobacter pylori]MCQ2862821.1 hypothetical protein [Helicobacter pylori]MCQ2881679.1 hypothetical protein [Helicobacter pylori]
MFEAALLFIERDNLVVEFVVFSFQIGGFSISAAFLWVSSVFSLVSFSLACHN